MSGIRSIFSLALAAMLALANAFDAFAVAVERGFVRLGEFIGAAWRDFSPEPFALDTGISTSFGRPTGSPLAAALQQMIEHERDYDHRAAKRNC